MYAPSLSLLNKKVIDLAKFGLTEEEQRHVPVFVKSFKQRVGRDKIISNSQIQKHFRNLGVKMPGARVRKIINYIRIKGLVKGLIATSKGYYVSNDPGELKKYIHSLHQRESAIHEIRLSIQDYFDYLSGGNVQKSENGNR